MKRLSAQDHHALKALLQKKGLLAKTPAENGSAANDPPPFWPVQSAVERLWLQECVDGDRRVNGLGVWVRFEQPYALTSITQALQALAERHETLRTVYETRDDQLIAHVQPAATVVLAAAIATPDSAALTALLDTSSPGLMHDHTWRIHPVLEASGRCIGLVWLMHHAVCDWFGLQVLAHELSTLLQGGALPDDIPMQPRRVSALEQQRPASQTDTLRAYWRTRLEGAPERFAPPVMLAHTPPLTDEPACDRFCVTIEPDKAQALRTLCRQLKTTPWFFLLTVFVRLLQRLTLNNELVIATTIAHRDRPGTAGLAGCLSDLIPLRCDPAPEAPFIDALRHIQAAVSTDMAHAGLGLRQIMDAAQPQRQPGKAPLTQIMFNMLPPFSAPGLTLTPAPLPVPRTDLVLEIAEHDSFSAVLECRRSRFPAGFAQTLARSWEHDVNRALAAATPGIHLVTPVAYPPAGPTHTPGTLTSAPATPVIAPTEPARLPVARVIDLFTQQARHTPDATALIANGHALSYTALLTKVDLLARQLNDHPAFTTGCRVAIWLPRSVELVVAVLACLKAGGVMMLLDPAHPEQRQRQILATADPDILVAMSDTGIPAHRTLPVLHPPGIHERPPTAHGQPPAQSDPTSDETRAANAYRSAVTVARHAPDAAFIAFTSGSTGTPKGVVCTQHALINRLAWYASTFPALPDDVACLKTSPGFVDSYAEMLGPLCAGIPLVIAPDDSATDPVALSALLGRHKITRLVLVPTLLRALLAHGNVAGLQSLRLCACSGEPLDPSLAQAFLNAVPGCRLINIYGSSEVTADATWADIAPRLGARTDIGKPLPGVAVAVVDAAGHAVPDGFPGELAISGISLADSYLDDPALTARRFKPLPAFGGQRAFLSGDLAIQSPGGPLLLLGRHDRQLKLEGVRIDAAEIESALAAQPGILCSRVVMDDSAAPPRLIAAVVATTPPDESALRQRLHTHLPRAAIPHQWVWMDALPVGATGKIDDAALLTMARQAPSLTRSAVQNQTPLRTDTERLLAQQWSEVLGCRITSRDAHFFDLGGTSLKAIMAMNRLRKATGLVADVRWLFETPSLAALAERIECTAQAKHAGTDTLDPPGEPEPDAPVALAAPLTNPITTEAPLTFNQQWLIREYALHPQRTAYNLAIAYRFDGQHDTATLQRALQYLSDRHQALRTRLKQNQGQWAQYVDPPGTPFQVMCHDTPMMDDAAAVGHRDRRAGQPFLLDDGPLFRVEICRVNTERLYLIMTAHHAMIDGWSSQRLMQDLTGHYAALCGLQAHPDDTPPGIGDIALRQQTRLAAVSEPLQAYRQAVSQASCPRIPSAGGGKQRGGPLARLVIAGYDRRTDSSGITPFMRGLCALTFALQQFNVLDGPVRIGFPEAGRHDPDLEDSAAFLANTLLGSFDLAGQQTWPEALQAIQTQIMQALSFRDIPAFWLQDLGWKGLDDRSDDLHVMVVPEQDFDWNLALPGLHITSLGQAPSTQARVDLALTITSAPTGGAVFGLEYDSQRIPADVAERLAGVIRMGLTLATTPASGTAAPTDRASQPLCEWHRHLPERLALTGSGEDTPWQPAPPHENMPAQHVPGDENARTPRRLDALMAQHAARRPDQRLAADLDKKLSAAQLWAHAGELALAMRQHHPAPGTIALAMERSTDWLACLLAIWQNGATAVIIDTQWPAERADAVIQDSGATLLWTGTSGVNIPDRAGIAPAEASSLQDTSTTPPNPVAAIVYTSGSSGRPKGIPIRHDALVRLAHSLACHYELTPDSTILQVVAPAFDVTLSDIAMSWYTGATLVTLPRHAVMPGTTLNETLDAWGITHMQVPPAVLNSTAARAHPSLKVVAVGGEICPTQTLESWACDRTLFIVYGPTETTVTASLTRYASGQAPGSLGKAIAGNRMAIINEAGQPVLHGMPGELLIAGPQVAQTYHGHARSLASAFGQTRLFGELCPAYRTGDRAWMDEHGHVWLLGRLDRQFKIRGQRIDPEEIEVTLRQHPAIGAVAITAQSVNNPSSDTTPTDREIIAWVVPSHDPLPSDEALRQWLHERLPAAWLPSRWVRLEALPLNANGKTDWTTLARMARELPAAGIRPGAPDTVPDPGNENTRPQETATGDTNTANAAVPLLEDRDDLVDFLYACWSELLERDDIDTDRSFFDYGGHSMLTVKLHERLEQATGLTLPIGEIFGHPTLDAMADYLLEQITTRNTTP